MKTHLTFLFLFFACTLFGQTERTRYSLVYSIHLSDAAENGAGRYFDPGLGQSVFATVELSTKRSSRFTMGAGFLQSKMKHTDYLHVTYEDIGQIIRINSIVIPAGIKFSFGSFYVHPEVAASFNYLNTITSYFLDSEMNPLDEPYDHSMYKPPIEVQFTGLMNLGYEFKLGSLSLLTGVKGYFAFNNNYVNTFGAGLMVGLKV